MKITDRSNLDVMFVKDVTQGDVFKFEGNYYMKTTEISDEVGLTINAVDLNTGIFAIFDDDDEIILLNCKLTVG